jgi:enoyl-CoA hydratase
MSNYSTLILDIADRVAIITLNRPEARNALNLAMCEEITRACAELSARRDIHVAFVRGAGPVFCAGADLKERRGMDEDQVRGRRLKAFAAYDAIERLPMPVVAVVHGTAVGSGVEISAACDFIVATPGASFRTPEALWGTIGATQRLPRILGKRLAKDMMFTGRALGAEEALLHGLVARIVAPDELESTVEEIAKTLVEAPAGAMRLAKRSIDRGVELDPKGALATELLAIEEVLAGAEWRERIGGFGDKAGKDAVK